MTDISVAATGNPADGFSVCTAHDPARLAPAEPTGSRTSLERVSCISGRHALFSFVSTIHSICSTHCFCHKPVRIICRNACCSAYQRSALRHVHRRCLSICCKGIRSGFTCSTLAGDGKATAGARTRDTVGRQHQRGEPRHGQHSRQLRGWHWVRSRIGVRTDGRVHGIELHHAGSCGDASRADRAPLPQLIVL